MCCPGVKRRTARRELLKAGAFLDEPAFGHRRSLTEIGDKVRVEEAPHMDKRQNRIVEACCFIAVPASMLLTIVLARMILG
ncbi:hypothetical protein X742_01145 [Mesorhizobium sp. LNHC232B00]|nr:hypothetical protein X742_01145 [Mesorhizobium sp. LNHC232B00]